MVPCHDICDTRPDSFACDDTNDCVELHELEEDGMCHDSYRPDVPGDGTIFHQARVDDRSTGVMSIPKPTGMEDRDRPLPSDSEPREIPKQAAWFRWALSLCYGCTHTR